MRNTLASLNDMLFEQIERVNDDDLHGEELEEQLKKSKMIVSTGSVIVKNAELILKAHEYNTKAKEDNLLPEESEAVPKILIAAS